MLTIRLARIGRKNTPSYRLVISEKGRDTFGRSLEILGHYHPTQKNEKDKLIINKERIEHWLKNGAQASETVHNLLLDAGLLKGEKKRTIGRRKSKKQLEEENKAKEAAVTKKEETKNEEQPTEKSGEAKAEITSEAKDEKVGEEKKEASDDKNSNKSIKDNDTTEEKV